MTFKNIGFLHLGNLGQVSKKGSAIHALKYGLWAFSHAVKPSEDIAGIVKRIRDPAFNYLDK